MIKKFFIYCMSDGIIPAVRFACKTLFSKLLSNSTTVFLEYENCRSKHSDMNSCITIKKTELTDVIKLDFPRLKESDYQSLSMYKRGSVCDLAASDVVYHAALTRRAFLLR